MQLLENREVIVAFTFALTRDAYAAEEIFQNVAVVILDEAGRGTQVNEFLPWAREIVRRKVAEYYRKQSTRKLKEQLAGSMTEVISSLFDEEALSAETLRARREMLSACMEKLSGRAREIIQRRYQDDLSIAEIAEAVAWDGASVRVALTRARKALGECVDLKLRAGGN